MSDFNTILPVKVSPSAGLHTSSPARKVITSRLHVDAAGTVTVVVDTSSLNVNQYTLLDVEIVDERIVVKLSKDLPMAGKDSA